MDDSEWFCQHLASSADGFLWAVEQVPAHRRVEPPPAPLGAWHTVRHVFHLVDYEERVALPSMRLWLAEPGSAITDWDEDAAWACGDQDLARLIERFRAVRAAQIALLPALRDSWDAVRETVWSHPEPWGAITLRWVVTKTFQHTAEHTHDVLRMALFWDHIAASMTSQHDESTPHAT